MKSPLIIAIGILSIACFAGDREALLAAIEAQPGEDAPRLVFADWLDEHDDAPRAEFIRVQVRLARMGPNEPERGDLEAREKTLLTENQARWLPKAFDQVFLREGSRVVWERGFAHGLVLQGERSVNSAKMRSAIDELSLLKSIDVLGREGDGFQPRSPVFIANLVKLKRLPGLVHLGLRRVLIDGPRAETLAEVPFTKLISLSLCEHPNGDPIVTELLHAPWMKRIRSLDLSRTILSDDAWARLASTAALSELEELRTTADPSVQLAAGNGMPKLKRFTLGGFRSGGQKMPAMLSSPRFQQLVSLNILYNFVGRNENRQDAAPAALHLLRAIERVPHNLRDVNVYTTLAHSSPQPLSIQFPPGLVRQLQRNTANGVCAGFLDLLSTE